MFMINPENSNQHQSEDRIYLSPAVQVELETWGTAVLDELEERYQDFQTKQTLRDWLFKTRG